MECMWNIHGEHMVLHGPHVASLQGFSGASLWALGVGIGELVSPRFISQACKPPGSFLQAGELYSHGHCWPMLLCSFHPCTVGGSLLNVWFSMIILLHSHRQPKNKSVCYSFCSVQSWAPYVCILTPSMGPGNLNVRSALVMLILFLWHSGKQSVYMHIYPSPVCSHGQPKSIFTVFISYLLWSHGQCTPV